MPFAVDPHGSGVHGSRRTPTSRLWKGVAPGGRENSAPGGRLTRRPPFPFRRVPHPRSTDTASARRVSGAGAGFKAQGRKEESTNEWAAAVEDLKTRHAAAAPRRAPRPLSRSITPRARPRVPAPRTAHPAPSPAS